MSGEGAFLTEETAKAEGAVGCLRASNEVNVAAVSTGQGGGRWETGSHWRVLSRDLTRTDLGFNSILLSDGFDL